MVVFLDTLYVIYQVRMGYCHFYEWMGWCLAAYAVSMMVLFGGFYVNEYMKVGPTHGIPHSTLPIGGSDFIERSNLAPPLAYDIHSLAILSLSVLYS